MARLKFEAVSKTFPGDVRAVDCVSLEVGDGEFVVLVGPSGSGKSTLLRLTAGLERLTGGAISFDGRRVDPLPPRRRNVSMAFQTPALYPHLSVRENIAFPLKMHKANPATIGERVAAIAKPLRIAGLLDRRPNELSGGERQRVALGRALVRDANCLLLDEPFAHLDGPLREQVRLDLLEIHRRRPTTTLCVTHDQNDALLLGQRVAVMAAGKLQQVGPPLEIYDAPANRFVAGFFGSPPMQFLEGRIQGTGNRGQGTGDRKQGTEKRGQGSGDRGPSVDGLSFVAGTMRLPVPDSIALRLRGRMGETIVLGLRSESIRIAAGAQFGGIAFTADVRASEVLGDRVFHRIETPDGQSLIAAGTRETTALSGRQLFATDSTAMRFFAPGSFGARL